MKQSTIRGAAVGCLVAAAACAVASMTAITLDEAVACAACSGVFGFLGSSFLAAVEVRRES